MDKFLLQTQQVYPVRKILSWSDEKQCMLEEDNDFKEINNEQLLQLFDGITQFGKCYKCTVTFNRKRWQKRKAFNDVYYKLYKLLRQHNVDRALFTMELHKDEWPHIHGVFQWDNRIDDSPDALRSVLVGTFGQTKIFQLKEEDFDKEEKKYPSWGHYMVKDYRVMLDYRKDVAVEFHIATCYNAFKSEKNILW